MKRILLLLLLPVLLLSTFGFTAGQKVYDQAGLLSESEKVYFQAEAIRIAEEQEVDVILLTVSDAKGKSAMEVADDFYDENAFGYDAPHGTGILFLIDMDNRQAWISTSGEAITYFTDQRIEWTLDNIFEFLPDGNYAGSFQAFLDSVELYMNRPVRAGETSDGSVWWAGNLFQAGVGLVVGLIVVFTFIARSRSRMTAGNRDYMTGVRMNVADDQFLRKAVTVRRIPKNTGGSGGGSSTHTSGGGFSHGGGGRGF